MLLNMKKQSKKKRKFTWTEIYISLKALESDLKKFSEFISAMDKQLDRILELFNGSKVSRSDFELLEKKAASLSS